MTDIEKSLGVPTMMTYSLVGFFVLFLILLLIYVLFSPIAQEVMKII